jgi:spore maturation protein CgeB
MKMIYHGPLWDGSTALQRADGFRHWLGGRLIALDNQHRIKKRTGFERIAHGVLWRLGLPLDANRSVARLEADIIKHRPDVVFIDSSQFISAAVLRRFRERHRALYVYYTPDNILYRGNRSRWLLTSLPHWDLFFTTKMTKVQQLKRLGVTRAIGVGKSFDPILHQPLSQEEVGPEFEQFDAVFMGAYEREREEAVSALATAGMRVVVYSNDWPRSRRPANVEVRGVVVGRDYVRALHYGKIALCFLRKIMDDQITQRSMEITAVGRPMLGEKTAEHDQHFLEGREYAGFRDIPELVAQAKSLLADDESRTRMGQAGRKRCLMSGYSTIDRAKYMLESIDAAFVKQEN